MFGGASREYNEGNMVEYDMFDKRLVIVWGEIRLHGCTDWTERLLYQFVMKTNFLHHFGGDSQMV